MKFNVLGTGSYVPTKIISNDDLSNIVDTNDEWITKRVGIKTRHVSEDETTSSLATKAALNALESSKTRPEELDMIIAATITGEYVSPGVSCMVQKNIGATCPCMDIGGTACTGFIYLVETAAAYLALGKAKKILIIGAERLSDIVDWSDRGTCIIFGDGASAMVVDGEEDNLLASDIQTYGNNEVIKIPKVSGHSPFFKGETYDNPYMQMNGHETYKFAVNAIRSNVNNMMETLDLSDDDIRYVIPHQANIRIINEAKRKLSISKNKFLSNIDRIGNTSSASIGIIIDEKNRSGELEKGDKIILVGFGGGLCSGTCVIQW